MRQLANYLIFRLAERKGFEPLEAFTSTVFKTAAIDHSAISPLRAAKVLIFSFPAKLFI